MSEIVASRKSLFESKEATTTNAPTVATSSSSPVKSVFLKPANERVNANNNETRLKNSSNHQQHIQNNLSTVSSHQKSLNDKNPQNCAKNQFGNFCVSHQLSVPTNVNDKMVAQQEITSNENEDFKYGPGFVSKLRYRYLSLTLRQASVSKQRPSLAQFRRSTSLNNLLDEESEEIQGQDEEEDDALKENEMIVFNENISTNNENNVLSENQKNNRNGIDKSLTESYPSDGQQHQHHHRVSRSIDKTLNLKRARSVEAILRYDHSAWERDVQKENGSSNRESSVESVNIRAAPTDVTIEDKILQARERPSSHPPKRLTSLIDDGERPPPGICKQTMRIFEASANKKRPQSRPIGQEIANKVAIFKSQEKPAVSAKKPNIMPRTTSPKPFNHQLNHSQNIINNRAMNNNEKFAKYTKAKTVLPKLDINIIKNNLETKTNGSRSPVDEMDYRSNKLDYSSAASDSSISSTPNILSPPFRNSMSPQLYDPSKKLLQTNSTPNVVDPSSPSIHLLTSKLNNIHMDSSTPKTHYKANNLLKNIDDSSAAVVDGSDKEMSVTDNKMKNCDGKNSDLKSAHDDGSSFLGLNFMPKINNHDNLSSADTNSKLHEKCVTEVNNVDVKLVKDVITKPTSAPPPPPTDILINNNNNNNNNNTMKSRDTDTKSSFVPSLSTDAKLTTGSDGESSSSKAPKWTVKKKSWSSSSDETTNTIVFNFSDRKDVPDYIEHDGLILRRKRELPKPNESGFVLLGDLTLDSSTDPDDGYQMGPPSPCDVEFENANIVPDGKSSIRTRVKEVKFKIQFDDSLTATFEYPSETSLLIDETFGNTVDDEVDSNSYDRHPITGSSKLMTSVPSGSTPFGNYQPQKANAASFELGITRTTPSPSSASSEENTFISNNESDDDYLKPATDEESQRWSSEGTRATDLLF